ncbi:hypothetical protein GCM10022245_04260 [Streptomyces mayteni]
MPNERRPTLDSVPESAPTTSAPTSEPDATDQGTSSTEEAPDPVEHNARGRRSRAELLAEVRVLDPNRTTLSPNYVAERIGVSWTSAKSLLNEVGRLAAGKRTARDF